MILCLETATALCSVALCDKNGVIALRESNEERSHAASLTVFIVDLLKEAGIKTGDLQAVVVSKGPGSYTGLRIGVSAAKGIAYAASVPMVGVETTISMFHGFLSTSKDKYKFTETDLFCPVLDARRMEVYYSVFDINGNTVKETRAEIMDKDSFSDLPVSSNIFLFGDGAAKCREVVKRKKIFIEDDFKISAAYMVKYAYEAIESSRFEDVAYFEPFYLKDFLTSKPVKNILGK